MFSLICNSIMSHKKGKLSSHLVIKQSFHHFPGLSSRNFWFKMFLIIQKMYLRISKKVLIETFQFFFRWFGMHSEIVGRLSDPLTHSKRPILGSGSVCYRHYIRGTIKIYYQKRFLNNCCFCQMVFWVGF